MTACLIDYPSIFHNRVCSKGLFSTNMEIDIDAKERADRMAAAEAMSALSAVIVNHGGDSPTSPRTSKRLASRGSRGGGRGRGRGRKSNNDSKSTNSEAKKSRSRTRANHDTTKPNVTDSTRNRPARVTSKSKVASKEDQAPKRSPRRRSRASLSETETPSRSKTRTKSQSSDNGDKEPQVTKSIATPSLPSLPSNLSLTLPSLNIPSLGTLPTLGSLSLFQTDTNGDKPKKQDNKSLPFKKRRLINSEQGEDSEDQDCRTEKSETTETPSNTPSLSSKLPIDPAQQIRLFGEIQAALTADEDGDIPLHLAVVHEHLPLVQKFIQLMKIARRSVDRFNKDKQTPLHLAVKLNFVAGVKALLAAGADVNFVDKTGCTSLHLAVKHQLPECLKLLVDGSKVEADFNTRNFEGLTPLHTAVELRNMKLMAYILDHRADINMMDGKSGRTALFHAAENNQDDVVEFLLKRGANPDVVNYAGSTAMMAAQARNYNHVTKMLSRASDWNEEDRSGSSSPASEISVYLPDVVNPSVVKPNVPKPNITGVWKHAMPLRNPATFNPATGTFVGSPSASTVEVTLTTQGSPQFIENIYQAESQSPRHVTRPGDLSNSDVDKKATVSSPGKISQHAKSQTVTTSEVVPRLSETAAQSSKTIRNTSDGITHMSKHTPNTVSQTSAEAQPSDSGRSESAKSKGEKVTPTSYNTGQNSEYNMSANIRAIGELARTSPAVAMQLQKLFEAKQKSMAAMISPTSNVKHNPNGGKESESDAVDARPESQTRPPTSSTPPGSRTLTTKASTTSQQTITSASSVTSVPTATSPLRMSHSPGTTVSSVTTTDMNTLIPSTVTRPESNIPRVVPAPSQVIGKVSHVVEKLPQQPERIISTGMVVEHPEYGLVFRPFGPGQIQRLNQPASVPRTTANPERKESEPVRQEKETPSDVMDNSEKGVTKQTEIMAEPPVSRKPTEAEVVKKSANSSKPTIPTMKEAVSSYPVTEKLLNSKPKTMAIPKSRPTESSIKTQESVSKPETGSAVIKSIANSFIAAKLRQRVLNSPQVDSAAKLAANSPTQASTTVRSSGAVMTAPERVPKLPQFGSRPANTTPESAPTVNPENVSKNPKGASRIIEHLSKPIDFDGPVLDLTKRKVEKTKKSEKRKKKETNGNGAGVKKKSVISSKDGKQGEAEDCGISEPMDTT